MSTDIIEITKKRGEILKMEIKVGSLLSLEHTIAKDLFGGVEWPWDVIPKISEFIIELGQTLSAEKYDRIGENIWVSKSAKISQTASLNGPLIVDEDVEIRHCAYIRGSSIIGKGAVVGNSTEIKNSVLFDRTNVPHYNYIGDSILGYKAHMGAGSITSNVKSDKSIIKVLYNGNRIDTGLKKFGAIVGDFVEVGCNAVLNPGTIIGKNSSVYPLSSVRGVVPTNSIYKSANTIAEKV